MAEMSVVQEIFDMLGVESEMDAYRKKYLALKQKCEQIQQANEKLVNRLYHCKKLVKQYKKERRCLMNKLDEHGDKYQDAMVPAQWDESQIYNLLAGMRPDTEGASGETEPPAGESMDHEPEVKPGKKISKKSSKPKQPVNAFAIFCQQRQAAVVQQYYMECQNDISDEELIKRLTQQWNALPPEDKKVYHELYYKEIERITGQKPPPEMPQESSESALAVAAIMDDGDDEDDDENFELDV